jgi:hypothetical protein
MNSGKMSWLAQTPFAKKVSANMRKRLADILPVSIQEAGKPLFTVVAIDSGY